jgi:hypothetical protein
MHSETSKVIRVAVVDFKVVVVGIVVDVGGCVAGMLGVLMQSLSSTYCVEPVALWTIFAGSRSLASPWDTQAPGLTSTATQVGEARHNAWQAVALKGAWKTPFSEVVSFLAVHS